MSNPNVATDSPTTFKKGKSGNPKGKKKGTKSFNTLWKKAVKKIAEANPEIIKSLDDLDIQLINKAIAEAKNGNYQFYKDIYDRRLGKAKESLDLTSQGGKVEGIIFEVIKKNETENADKRSAGEEPGGAEQPKDQDNSQ